MTAGLQINFSGEAEAAADEDMTAAAAAVAQNGAPSSPTLAVVGQTPVPTPAATQAPATTAAPSTPQTGQQVGLSTFERAQVARTEIRISGTAAIDTRDGIEVSLDDRIRVVGQFRVTKITHGVDKNGDVVRTQYVTPIEDLELCPFDPSDPNDDGIVRARP